MSKYSKFIVTAVGVVLTGLNVLYGSDPMVQMVISLATAFGVYQVPNKK